MTKRQLLIQKEELLKQIEQIDKRIEEIGNTLVLRDIEMPFEKWNLGEMDDLFILNEKACDWFLKPENKDKTVADYNYTVIRSKDKIIVRNYKDIED